MRLGGSEKISKSLNENTGEKFQENIIVNTDYANLQRLIYGLYTGQKQIPYDNSKLTKVLRQTVALNSSIILLGCLNPNEANFEDSLGTLTHLERCKFFEMSGKENNGMDLNQKASAVEQQPTALQVKPKGQDNMLQVLQSEINELKMKTENLEKDYKSKFLQLGTLLSIDDDIEKLLYMKKDKKWMELNDQRRAVDRYSNLMTVNKELEKKLDQ